MQVLIVLCRLTQCPICFRTFLRKSSLLNLYENGGSLIFYPRVFVWDYDLFRDNIRYDLLRTGNVGRSTEKILERGFLDAVGTIRSVSQSSSDFQHTEHSRQLHIIRFTPEQLTARLPLQDM